MAYTMSSYLFENYPPSAITHQPSNLPKATHRTSAIKHQTSNIVHSLHDNNSKVDTMIMTYFFISYFLCNKQHSNSPEFSKPVSIRQFMLDDIVTQFQSPFFVL